MIYLAAFVLLMALLLMGLAWLTAHRTIFPHVRKPGLVWWPAVLLFFLAPVIAVSGDYFNYTMCQRTCNIADGGEVTEVYTETVPGDYKSCVKNGLDEIRRQALDQIKAGVDVDPDAVAAKAEPDTRALCRNMAEGRCVIMCYNPDAGI